MEATGGLYKSRDRILEELEKMSKFGHVGRQFSEYVFKHCTTCSGLMLGHITMQNECKRAKNMETEIENIEKEIKCSVAFEISLAKMDERAVVKKCDSCGETFRN
jgi:hypothetical protein